MSTNPTPEIGPCPLCKSEYESAFLRSDVHCINTGCELYSASMSVEAWNAVSRLRSENEALQSKLSDQQQVSRDLAETALNQKKELRQLVKQNEALRVKLGETNNG